MRLIRAKAAGLRSDLCTVPKGGKETDAFAARLQLSVEVAVRAKRCPSLSVNDTLREGRHFASAATHLQNPTEEVN